MIATKVEPIDRDIALFISEELSPAARSRTLAEFAREQIDEARAVNAGALGHEAPVSVFVDGVRGGALDRVRPDGVIVAEFDLVRDVVIGIGDLLEKHSPVGRRPKRRRYWQSHRLFVDGNEVTDLRSIPPDAAEYVFLNLKPYARRVERGWSKQTPDGVYQVVAALARQRFGNIAKIQFTYRELRGEPESDSERRARPGRVTDLRQPAIVIKV